ncbi:hypothetical protein BJ912DRAFT_148471 [Pholiota molesta]|nr:hypothetical protein BJ912DRAFT_148471 [Pholiota molesta]
MDKRFSRKMSKMIILTPNLQLSITVTMMKTPTMATATGDLGPCYDTFYISTVFHWLLIYIALYVNPTKRRLYFGNDHI